MTGRSQFQSNYARYRDTVLGPTEKRLREILWSWRDDQFWEDLRPDPGDDGSVAIPSPIQRVKTRIKRPESTLDKFSKLREEFPDGPTSENLRSMRDILGARIVTYIPAHIPLVDSAIRGSDDLEVSTEYPPRSYFHQTTMERLGLADLDFVPKGVKPSGYSSLHYFVRLREPAARENPWFELQVRTMLEEVWGEIEHQLGYKPNQQTEFSVSRQFRVIGSHLSAIDEHFDFLYDRLDFLQSRSNPDETDQINAENLPRVLHDAEIRVLQSEVGKLVDILASWEIFTVGELRSRLAAEAVEAIRNEYRKLHPGSPISAFHYVAALATLGPRPSARRARSALRAQMKLVDLVTKEGQASRSHASGREQSRPGASPLGRPSRLADKTSGSSLKKGRTPKSSS